jgi:hypothetical protein
MNGKSAIFAVALLAGTWAIASGVYERSDPKPVHTRVVVDGMKTRIVDSRRHVVVPHYKVVAVDSMKTKVVDKPHKVARKPLDL